VFWWVYLVIQILFIVWIITGSMANGHAHCNGLSAHDCAAATDTGNAIGIGLIVALWVAADIIIGGSYAIWRLARRGR
jgi:hypothetical protein